MSKEMKVYRSVAMDMTQDGMPVLNEDSYWYNGPVMLLQGEEDGDDSGGDDKDPDPPKTDEDLKNTLNELKEISKGNSEAIKHINEALKGLKQPKEDPDDDKGKKSGYDAPPKDVEYMDRKEYAEYIIQLMESRLNPKLEDTQKAVKSIDERVQSGELRREADKIRADENTKDFDEWQQELRKKLTNNPYLSLHEAYQLVRLENPKKAKELNEKYWPAKPKDSDEDEPFGGLPPLQKKISKAKKEKKPKSAQEATDLAWSMVMGDKSDIE
jgi:hypothetical protein